MAWLKKMPADVVNMMGLGNPKDWSGAAYALLLARLGEDATTRVAEWPRNVDSVFPRPGQIRANWDALKQARHLKPRHVEARPRYVDPTWISLGD